MRHPPVVIGIAIASFIVVAAPTTHPAALGPQQISLAPAAATHEIDVLDSYLIPGECAYPESIAVRGDKYYVGSVCNGQLYRGDLAEPSAEVFVPADPTPFEMSGIKATANRLVVARGNGFASVFNRFTGATVAQFSNGLGYDSVVNDVAIAPNGDAYLTEFLLSRLYRIPAADIARHQSRVQELPVFLDFRGTAFPVQEASANGIAATPDGRFLIVAHFSAGELYRVRISDGQVNRIDLGGTRLASPDAIILTEANVLYVVEFDTQNIAKISLAGHYTRGQIVSRTTSPLFQCPTGVARSGDHLLVTNSQFCGPGEPPFTVTSIPIP
jgi:sugar lactone lactonase YvrE